MCRPVQITLRFLPHLVTLNLQATSRDIQWRATSFFKFGLPFPPWMAYIVLLKNGLGDCNSTAGGAKPADCAWIVGYSNSFISLRRTLSGHSIDISSKLFQYHGRKT